MALIHLWLNYSNSLREYVTSGPTADYDCYFHADAPRMPHVTGDWAKLLACLLPEYPCPALLPFYFLLLHR